MIRINLLPYVEKKKKETRKSELLILAVSCGVFLLVLAGVFFFMTTTISSLQDDIQKKEARVTALNKIIGEIEIFKADGQLMKKKLDVIQGLEKNRLYPVKMVDELSTLIPSKEMWLEKIQETGTELLIDGIARDSIVVARFMKSLETASFIQSVDLISSTQKEYVGVNVKLQHFILKCVTRRGQ